MASQRYIRILLVASLGFYFALRVGLAAYCEFTLRTQDFRTKNRLANLRILPRDGVLTAVNLYVAAMPHGERNIVFLGDSQTYGYGRPPSATCAAILQKEFSIPAGGIAVHNLSVINGRFRDSMRIVEALGKHGVPVETIVLSSNPSHFIRGSSASPDGEYYIPRLQSQKGVFAALLFTRDNVFELTGASWRNTRKGHPVDLFDELVKPADAFAMAAVGKGYCADLDPEPVLCDLTALMQAAQRLANRVVFFTQPRFYADYLKPPYDYGWQPRPVDEAVLSLARESRCDVVLDLADSFPRDHFSDLIHLNQRGHEALARILQPHLLNVPPL
jgi:lysophospholipase L1-like esterase